MQYKVNFKDRQQSCNRGLFDVLPLKWACYLAVSSINMHDTMLNTQLIITSIDTNIIKRDKGKYI